MPASWIVEGIDVFEQGQFDLPPGLPYAAPILFCSYFARPSITDNYQVPYDARLNGVRTSAVAEKWSKVILR
jgi:hypothetical protein